MFKKLAIIFVAVFGVLEVRPVKLYVLVVIPEATTLVSAIL